MDKYTLETDGSYFEPMGIGGIGGVLYKNGQVIDAYSLASTQIKNEYESISILYGLLLAKKYGAQDLLLKTDSLHHVSLFKSNYQAYLSKQIEESYKTKALKIAEDFDRFTIMFQKREQNRTADKLSTQYKNNGYVSVSKPIETLGILPNDLFLDNKNHIKNKSKGVTMFDISFVSNKNERQKKIFLNIIHYDRQTNQLKIKTQEIENDLGKVSEMIYENLKDKPGHNMVINGEGAEIIRQALAKQKGISRSLHASFLDLSATLSNSPVVVSNRKKTNHKALKTKTNEADIGSKKEEIKAVKPKKPDVHTTAQLLEATPEEISPSSYHVYIKTGSVVLSNNKVKCKNIICEAYYINKQTHEVFYRHETSQYSPDGCIELLNKLLKKEGYSYTLDLEGEFLPAFMSSYSNGSSSASIKEKFKKLNGVHFTISNDNEQNLQYQKYALNVLTNPNDTTKNALLLSSIKSSDSVIDTSVKLNDSTSIEQIPLKNKTQLNQEKYLSYVMDIIKNQIENVKKTTISWKKTFKF